MDRAKTIQPKRPVNLAQRGALLIRPAAGTPISLKTANEALDYDREHGRNDGSTG